MKKLNQIRKIVSIALFVYGTYQGAKRLGLLGKKQTA
jgi:hypothetical protein